jgi:hypothetical protein
MQNVKRKMQNNSAKFKIFLVLICCFTLYALSFKFVSAYELLEPLPEGQGEIVETGLTDYLSWLFKFALAAAAFLAVLQIVIGGLQIISGGASETARSNAKKRIQDALWGLLLAFGAVLILETISPGQFTNLSLSITPVTIEAPAPTPTPTPTIGTLSDYQAKSQLNAAMVGYKSNVSFEGIRQATIDEAKALSFDLQKKGIGTSYEQITSGTEGSHAEGTYSHANGYKIDLRMNDQLTNFIKNNYTYIGVRSDGTIQYMSSSGAIYAKEGDHWDVLVK